MLSTASFAWAEVTDYAMVPARLDNNIRVESVQKNNGQYEVVQLPDGSIVEIPITITPAQIYQSGFTFDQVEEVREQARETLELTLKGVLSEDFSGQIIVGNQEAAVLKPKGSKTLNFFKKLFAYNNQAYEPIPKDLKPTQKLTSLVKMVWQFVFVETIHAGIDYYKQIKRVGPRFNEFGIAVDFKIEPQIFVGKFNPTQKFKVLSKSYALFFEVSYSRTLHRVMLRSRFRREKGSGGLGLPAVKAELKVFQSDGKDQAYKGKAWYPISPPLVSFVLDSSEHYFAQGITVGLNTGDLVPGSTLTNTFTEFVQTENHIQLNDVPQQATDMVLRAANGILPQAQPVQIKMCSQLFSLI